eukprot:TRINITY_DN20129_c0_g4_i1.p1 TRINITY_DN20129_c0_g4~~TRINITY_DN20129_c0_g4_i1.p1  ORF type:complete len:2092 (-),score=290.03 TRINITY_DN20129_c0_g4_i1:73-6348(-)
MDAAGEHGHNPGSSRKMSFLDFSSAGGRNNVNRRRPSNIGRIFPNAEDAKSSGEEGSMSPKNEARQRRQSVHENMDAKQRGRKRRSTRTKKGENEGTRLIEFSEDAMPPIHRNSALSRNSSVDAGLRSSSRGSRCVEQVKVTGKLGGSVISDDPFADSPLTASRSSTELRPGRRPSAVGRRVSVDQVNMSAKRGRSSGGEDAFNGIDLQRVQRRFSIPAGSNPASKRGSVAGRRRSSSLATGVSESDEEARTARPSLPTNRGSITALAAAASFGKKTRRSTLHNATSVLAARRRSAFQSHRDSDVDIRELRMQLSAGLQSDQEVLLEESSEEELEGLPIRRPMDRRMNENAEGGEAPAAQAPTLNSKGLRLQQLSLFSSFSLQTLQAIEGLVEEQAVAKDECIVAEGERQTWLGILDTGSARISVASDSDTCLGTLGVGECFGELSLLKVRDVRSSSVIAETDCRVFILHASMLWDVVAAFDNEREQLFNEAERWKAFLSSRFVLPCHPEIAYLLRKRAAKRVLVNAEEIDVGAKAGETGHMSATTAIVEFGCLRSADDATSDDDNDEVDAGSKFVAGTVVNDCGVLGIPQLAKVVSSGGPCGITLLTRKMFWETVSNLTADKEHFTRLALDRLPPSTFDLGACDLLSYLHGTHSFWRSMQGVARQRVCVPGSEICRQGVTSDALRIIQQGAVAIVAQGHHIRVIGNGDEGCYSGDMNFLGLISTCTTTLVAMDFCVLQELTRRDMEPHFARHQSVRSRVRDLVKLKANIKHDVGMQVQVHCLRDIPFFSAMSDEFLRDILPELEDRIYLPRQVVTSPQTSGNFMSLIISGQAVRKVENEASAEHVGPGAVVGDIAMLCDPGGPGGPPGETLVADSVCYIQHLHRFLLIQSLKRVPSEKHHFATIARAFAQSSAAASGNSDREDVNSNIYTLPFFKNCGSRFLYLLDLHLERHMFFCDEEIVHENTEGEDMYILYSGVARVTVRGVKVAELCGGMCFGEMAVLGLVKKRTATISAQTVCDIRILSRKSLEDAIKEFPEERRRFESLAATRHRMSQEKQYGSKITQTSRFFKGCNAEFAAALTDCMEDRLYTEGQTIMEEGDEGDWMVLIHQGRCEVLLGGEQVAIVGSGDIFGEMAVLGISSVRTATIRALDVCFVQVLHRAQMLPVVEKFPAERAQMRLQAAQRMQDRPTSTDSVRCLDLWKDSFKPFTDYMDQYLQRWVFFLGDILTKQGSKGDFLFMIMRGAMRVSVDDVLVGELGNGDIAGELAVMDVCEKRTATVTCTDLSDVYSLKRKDLKAALKLWPDQEVALRGLAARRLRNDVERETGDRSFLQNCPLFEQSSLKFIQCISAHLEDKVYMPGEVLCHQGDPGDTMYILMKGELACELSPTNIQELKEGSIIGEIAVLGLSNTRTATLRAKQVCLVQILHRSNFMKYLSEFPREMMHFQEVGASRLAKFADRVDPSIFQGQFLFQDSGLEFLERLSKRLQRKFFFASQKIVKEGSESNEMHVILRGEVVVEKRGAFMRMLEAGHSFGEMAVLGITTAQSLTVRAESLTDMQVLSRWDLEELLEEFPEERQRLLDVVANMMREDLAGVTNVEILSEVSFFQSVHDRLVERLANDMIVGLCRKDELVADTTDSSLFVILQGAAMVEINGVPVREVSIGDHYGAAHVIGACELRNATVRASASCLTMRLPAQVLSKALDAFPKTRKTFQDMVTKLTRTSADMRHAVLASAPVIQHMQIPLAHLKEVLWYCEERVFQANEEVLPSHLRGPTLLVVVNGQARIGSTSDGIVLEQSCAVGELADESRPFVGESIYAATLCKVLVLYRKAFAVWLDTRPPDESAAMLARLDVMPRKNGSVALVGSSLRQRADKMAAECIKAAKLSIQAHQRLTTELGPKKKKTKGWMLAKENLLSSNDVSLMPAAAAMRRQLSTSGESGNNPATPTTRSKSRKSLASPPKRTSSAYLNQSSKEATMALQERLDCTELRRLAAAANAAAAAARRDEGRLREEANALRAQLATKTDAGGGTNYLLPSGTSCNLDSDSPNVVTAKRGLQQLKTRLRLAYERRRQLLRQLELEEAGEDGETSDK